MLKDSDVSREVSGQFSTFFDGSPQDRTRPMLTFQDDAEGAYTEAGGKLNALSWPLPEEIALRAVSPIAQYAKDKPPPAADAMTDDGSAVVTSV